MFSIRSMIRCARFFAMLLFLAGYFTSAAAQTRSLDFYLTKAIDNSPAITRQRNRADSARLQKEIINAELNRPSVRATGDYVYAPFSKHWGYDEAITDGGLYAALMNVDYPVFTRKKERVRKRAASINIRQTDYEIAKAKHELRRSVTDQYITVYRDEMRLQYLRDIHDLLQRQKAVIRSMASQGVSKIVDVKQLDIELQNNRIDRNGAENTYEKDLLQLNRQCGIAEPSTSVDLQRPAIAVDSSMAKQSRFMTQFKLDSLNVAAEQNISELKYQPDISVSGNTGLEAIKFTGIRNHFGYSVGMHLSIPIYDGHKKNIHRQQTALRQNSIDAYQRRFGVNRKLRLAGLKKQLQRNQSQVELIRQQLQQYRDLLSNYQKELSNGSLSVVDYLTVLRNYADARQRRIQTLGKQWQLENKINYWNW